MTTPLAELVPGQLWSVVQGDCLDMLTAIPDQSVDMVMFSPPYESARLCLERGENLNIARSTDEWVKWMRMVVQASLRVCKGLVVCVCEGQTHDFSWSGSPILLMADLIRLGITLRKPPIYRRDGTPGSGGPDWWRNGYEFCICCTNGGELPWSDNKVCGKPWKYKLGGELSYRTLDGERVNEKRKKRHTTTQRGTSKNGGKGDSQTVTRIITVPDKATPSNVIDCQTGGGHMGNNLAHDNEAPYPESLVEPFVLSFCPAGGIVLDPFSGSGTTGAVAVRLGRRFLGSDLRQSQVELSRLRISGITPPMFI